MREATHFADLRVVRLRRAAEGERAGCQQCGAGGDQQERQGRERGGVEDGRRGRRVPGHVMKGLAGWDLGAC